MKSYNYQIDYMVPNGTNKEIVFNEALLTIDHFLNNVVQSFIHSTSECVNLNTNYILLEGKYKNHICYKSFQGQEIQFLKPKSNSIFFVFSKKKFYLFSQDNWQVVIFKETPITERISGTHFLNHDASNIKLYLAADSHIILRPDLSKNITLIIKQVPNNSYKFTFSSNIFCENTNSLLQPIKGSHSRILKIYPIEQNKFFLKILSENINLN